MLLECTTDENQKSNNGRLLVGGELMTTQIGNLTVMHLLHILDFLEKRE